MPNFKMPSVSLKSRLNRRNFFKFTLGAVLSSYSSKSTFAVIDDMPFEERSLSLFNPRTKEDFDGIYWRNGDYVAAALENVNHLMRDIRTGDVKQIDTDLLDLIYKISLKLETEKPFHILSGYRSPKTNSMLLKHYENVAMNSYHLTGRAVDIRLPGLRISGLRRVAYELKEGGIGYYPRQRFVHIIHDKDLCILTLAQSGTGMDRKWLERFSVYCHRSDNDAMRLEGPYHRRL